MHGDFFCSFFVLQLVLVFRIGMCFGMPYTTDAKVIQHTIQLTPRLELIQNTMVG
jgi:hypothetical protein